jgi:cytochrome c oxidase subunit 1
VSSPPPIFNFDEIPQVVGGPYEYGTPGAVHAVLNGDRAKVAVPAGGTGNGHAAGASGNGHGNGNGHEDPHGE